MTDETTPGGPANQTGPEPQDAPFDPANPDRFHPKSLGWGIACPTCTVRALLANRLIQVAPLPNGVVKVGIPDPPPVQHKLLPFAPAGGGPGHTFDAARRLVIEGDVACPECGTILVGLAWRQDAPAVPAATQEQLQALSGLLGPDGQPLLRQ